MIYCWVCQWFFWSVNIWQSYKPERGCFVHFVCLATTLLNDEESARHSPPRYGSTPRFHRFYFSFTGGLANKPFLLWLLTIPPQLKYVTTVPCNLSLFTTLVCDCHSFSGISVRCGGIFYMRFAANLLQNLTAKKLKIGRELTELPPWVWCLLFCNTV